MKSVCAFQAATGSASSLTRTVARIASHSLSTAFSASGKHFFAHFSDGCAAITHWCFPSIASR